MSEPLVNRNNMAVVGWGFTAAWVSFVVMATGVVTRQGGLGQFDSMVETGILLMFWVLTLALLAHLMTKPRVRLEVRRGAAKLRLAWVFRRVEASLSPETLRGLVIAQTRDSDGDPYFELRLTGPTGNEAVLCESRDRSRVEAVLRDIRAKLGSGP